MLLAELCTQLRGLVCCRCKLMFEMHSDADHIFIECSEDIPINERN